MYKARANKHRKALTFKPGDLVWLHLRKDSHEGGETSLCQEGMVLSKSLKR